MDPSETKVFQAPKRLIRKELVIPTGDSIFFVFGKTVFVVPEKCKPDDNPCHDHERDKPKEQLLHLFSP